MIIPEKLKLNRFKPCPVRDGRDLYAQFGMTTAKEGGYTGDSDIHPGQSKLDEIKEGDKINQQKLREEAQE